MTVTLILTIPLFLLVSYVLGAFPFGWLIGKANGIDLFKVGSGNIGATNVFRNLGPYFGSLVMVIDVAKGLVLTAYWPGLPLYVCALGGLIAFLGNSYSVWLYLFARRFKGGKSVSTGLGVVLAIAPPVGFSIIVVWLAVLTAFRYISLASIVSGIVLPFLGLALGCPWWMILAFTGIGSWVYFRHGENRDRLKNLTEPQVNFPIWFDRILMFRLWFAWWFLGVRNADAQMVFMTCVLGNDEAASKKAGVARFWWMKIFPKVWVHWIVRRSPPWMRYMGATVVTLADGTRIASHVVGNIANFPDLIDPESEFFKWGHDRLLETAIFACRVIPTDMAVITLGGANSIAFNQGIDFVPLLTQALNEKNLHVPIVANGNTVTAISSLNHAAYIAAEQFGEKIPITFVIIGVGSVGNRLAEQALVTPFPTLERLILVGRETNREISSELNAKAVQLRKISGSVTVETMLREDALAVGQIVVYATNQSVAADTHAWHREDQAVLDAMKPPGTPKNLASKRPDLLVLASGLYQIDGNYGRALDLPPNQIYACGFEGLIISWLIHRKMLSNILENAKLKKRDLAFVGKPNCLITYSLNLFGKDLGMKPVPFQDPHTKQTVSTWDITRHAQRVRSLKQDTS